MLTVKYTKLGRARFLPHLDTLRHIQRILRRAEIEVEFSKGFNPHMQINLGQPLPLGFSSECEFFTVRTPISAGEFVGRFNAHSIEGLTVVDAVEVVKDPVVASIIKATTYEVEGEFVDTHADRISTALSNPEQRFNYLSKGQSVERVVGDSCLNFSIVGNILTATVLCGQNTLRLDRLLASLFPLEYRGFNIDIRRKIVYNIVSGELVELSNYLKTMAVEK